MRVLEHGKMNSLFVQHKILGIEQQHIVVVNAPQALATGNYDVSVRRIFRNHNFLVGINEASDLLFRMKKQQYKCRNSNQQWPPNLLLYSLFQTYQEKDKSVDNSQNQQAFDGRKDKNKEQSTKQTTNDAANRLETLN